MGALGALKRCLVPRGNAKIAVENAIPTDLTEALPRKRARSSGRAVAQRHTTPPPGLKHTHREKVLVRAGKVSAVS